MEDEWTFAYTDRVARCLWYWHGKRPENSRGHAKIRNGCTAFLDVRVEYKVQESGEPTFRMLADEDFVVEFSFDHEAKHKIKDHHLMAKGQPMTMDSDEAKDAFAWFKGGRNAGEE